MKRLIAALILTAIVIGVYIIGYIHIVNTCEKTNELIDECISAYEKGDNVTECSEKLKKFWSDNEKTLSIFENHAVLDEIELSLHILSVYSNYKDDGMFYDYAYRTRTLIHQMLDDTMFGMLSIV